ncbi:MAG TPA: CoA transferase [Burkholderiales bacterium]|nr:CoA transferase [Burkholderiales bacterium]
MPTAPLCELPALAAMIMDGAKLAVPSDNSGVAMAATRELVRRGARGLHLVCVPVSGMQADVMIGAGLLSTIETSAVSLAEFGVAPRFTAALRDKKLRMLESTCPAIHAALQAAQKGVPFTPLRGLIGSDVLTHRPDWKVIDNPFQTDDPIVVLPAIQPDIALFHAPLADRYGNVFIGRWRELLTLAHAARRTVVTVERITDHNLLEDIERSPGVIPALYVSGIAEVERGAWPLRFGAEYPADEPAIENYAAAARTKAGFESWLEAWLAHDSAQALA